MNKRVLAIIPARGGSKRFRGKNVYPLKGKPLLAYPIEAAKNSTLIDRVIVSTDDDKIASVAKEYGAEVPFMRPTELATDNSPVIDTMVYTLKELKKRENYHVDYTILLQAVSPLVTTELIDKAIDLALEKDADSVVAVSEVKTTNHPYNIREISENGTIKFWQEDKHYEYLTKSKEMFYHVSNIWVTNCRTLIGEHRLEGRNNYPLITDSIYSLDIDFKEDLEMIEAWLEYKQKNI